MIYLTAAMTKPAKVDYRVAYADRIYGWKTLFVQATSKIDAIDNAIRYLGFVPVAIDAVLEAEK